MKNFIFKPPHLLIFHRTIFPKPNYHFYFGEEPVKTEDLKHTVKLQDAGGRETAAWSNETGKGLLYYVREVASKTGPPGAILLVRTRIINFKSAC